MKILSKTMQSNGIAFYIIKFIILRLDVLCRFKISFLVAMNVTARPHYLYCFYHAGSLAKALGYNAFSVIEFGVAGGKGLLFLEQYAPRISKELDIKVEIFGFDLGDGLNSPYDYRDLPYWFNAGYYKMDQLKLQKKLVQSTLVIGDVEDTLNDFVDTYNPAPIGAIFNDLDYYSSTLSSFKLFQSKESALLPRVFCYFDDIIGSQHEMYGPLNGQLLAINEFNESHQTKKIYLNQNLVPIMSHTWRHQIFYMHDIHHQLYEKHCHESEQEKINSNLSLT